MKRSRSKLHLALALLTGGLASCFGPAAADDPGELTALEHDAAKRINIHRKASGLTWLAYDEKVATIARRHSERMARGKTPLGHDGLQARVKEIAKFIDVAGAAENVSKHRRESDFAEHAVKNWLASPVHRKNIDGDYGITGVGAALSAEGVVYFTQLFVKAR